MKITLRKASVLQKSLQDLTRSIALKTTVSISEFAKPSEVISRGQQEFEAQFDRKRRAVAATYAIRAAVAEANASSGINQLLTQVAETQAMIGVLEVFQNQSVETMLPAEEIAGRLEKIRQRPADGRHALYGTSDTVDTSVLGQDRLASIKRELQDLRKKKQNLQDRILELNVRTEVELGQEIEFLKAEGLI